MRRCESKTSLRRKLQAPRDWRTRRNVIRLPSERSHAQCVRLQRHLHKGSLR